MSVIDVKVPDIGDYKDVPIIEVHVKPGDRINPEDPLVTLESDKAAMEVPAPQAGEIAEVLVKVGDKVSEGSALVRLAGDGGAQGIEDEKAGDAPSAEAKTSEEKPADTPSQSPSSAVKAEPEAEPRGAQERVALPIGVDFGGVHASPSVRRLARELDIDLRTLKGTGEKGRITKDDVKRALGGGGGATPPAAPVEPDLRVPSMAEFVALHRRQTGG